MSEYEDSVMVALLPTTDHWCRIELPHVTLVYAGKISDLSDSIRNELAKETIAIAMDFKPFTVEVLKTDVFGEEEKVQVLILETTTEFKKMRERLVYWNKSKHKTFKPHATIGPVDAPTERPPARLTFDRVLFRWGTNNLICDLF